MENAVDALKIAGSVLLFVMALSICALSFSQAREAIDVILSYSDRESLTIENDERYYYLSDDNDTNRYVGKESIIPTIYRSYSESYKIVFNFTGDYYLFKKDEEEISTILFESTEIDPRGIVVANSTEARRFLDGLIYGKFDFTPQPGKEAKQQYEEHFGIKLNDTCLNDYLTNWLDNNPNNGIREFLGTYYINEIAIDTEVDEGTPVDGEYEDLEGIQEENKQEKRVITYNFTTRP